MTLGMQPSSLSPSLFQALPLRSGDAVLDAIGTAIGGVRRSTV